MTDQVITDIFEEETTVAPVVTTAVVKETDAAGITQLLMSIVNEDGTAKYKTVEEALKATAHAQNHIKVIEAENASLKEKGNASDKLDELLSAVKESKGGGKDGMPVSTIKSEDVLGIVKDFLNDNKAAEVRTSNIKIVTDEFKTRYGKDAKKELYTKAADLGFSEVEINSMIAKNPNAALKVLGITGKKAPVIDTVALKTGVSSSNFLQKPEEPRKSIMGSKTQDLLDAWEANKQKTYKNLGIA